MSMLAERKRKTKWVINPTKKPLWATDSNGIKFGKELMEKMGWSAGKGLGVKEQGIQEPLRVSYKNDTKGMGFKGNDDDWIEQQDEFNVLLNQLRNSDDSSVVKVTEEKNEIKSLEEKSKQSRARVHYQKFTRGKDLSRYSENDLACILGTNKLKKEKLKTEEVVETEEKTDGHLVTSFGVTTMNGGSIQDYFKKKWANNKVQSKSAPEVENEEGEYSCDERPSFKESLNLESREFSKKEHKAEDGSEMNGDLGEKHEKRKKRKKRDEETSEEEEPKSKRKKTSDEENPVDVELQNTLAGVAGNEAETENLLGNENDCDSRKRKKEKRRSKEDEGNDISEEAMIEVKKKKKKERKEKPVENGYCGTEEGTSIDCSLEAECQEGELVKKKSKGKTGNEVFAECGKEPSLEVIVGEMNDAVKEEDVAKGKKKKCKDVGESVEVDEPSVKNEELGKVSDVCEGDTVEVGSKKKKKKKEKQNEKMECCSNENGISCDILAEMNDDERNCNSFMELEQSKKKKKKKGDKVEYSSNENGISSEMPVEKCDSGSNPNCTTELEVKKKKKKKEKQDKMESNEIELFGPEKCDSENNVELDRVKKKKKKKEKKQDEVECHSKENGLSSEILEGKGDSGNSSNSTAELEVKKKKKKEKQDKKECLTSENGFSSEILEEGRDSGNSSNSFAEIEEVKKKKKKKEKQDKMECLTSENGLSSEIQEERGDSGNSSNSIMQQPSAELEEVKKKKKKKEKQDKMECLTSENGLSSEIQEEKGDSGNSSNSIMQQPSAELEEVKKKKKKKEKQDKMECLTSENGLSGEIQEEKGDSGNSSNSIAELEEVKKKKKKDKHKTKEEDSGGNDINGPSERETVDKKKKKKDKKEKHKSKEGSSVDDEENKESCADHQSTNGTRRKKKGKKSLESEGEEEKEAKPVEKAKEKENKGGNEGNAEIGTSGGIDRVELISQRAAYEHVAGQHKYERVKKLFESVNLGRFRGSNLEYLEGYGKSLKKCETSAR